MNANDSSETKNTICISLGGAPEASVNIVVEKYDDELVIYFQDKKTNCITQDIATIRQAKDGEQVIPGAVECLIWSDGSKEDYTDRFVINQFLEVA